MVARTVVPFDAGHSWRSSIDSPNLEPRISDLGPRVSSTVALGGCNEIQSENPITRITISNSAAAPCFTRSMSMGGWEGLESALGWRRSGNHTPCRRLSGRYGFRKQSVAADD